MIDLRVALALGETGENRQREVSVALPRRGEGLKYPHGGWYARQRAHSKEVFDSEGGKTLRYELNSKNIQEGKVELTIESVLKLKGNIGGNEYMFSATFTSAISARNKATGEGEDVGPLINPINVSL